MKNRGRVAILVRLTPEEKAGLQALAHASRRDVNSTVRQLVALAVVREDILDLAFDAGKRRVE